MKGFLRKFVLMILKGLARFRMKRYGGKVIAVVGSVGKTSTKDAIFTVLNGQFRVKRSEKSMNSEFGLPLTILDIKSGYSSATKWTWFLIKGFFNAFMKDHSEILLLELGTDKPGDMDFLVSIVKPDVVVMTNTAPTHMDEGQFKDLRDIFEEDSKVFSAIKKGGVAIMNTDNGFLKDFFEVYEGEKISFGIDMGADYRATGMKSDLEGLNFNINYDGKRVGAFAGVLGSYQVYVLLPAVICGLYLKMEMETVLEGLKRFSLPPGRMSVIEAFNGAMLLDSSYNSSPASVKEALGVLTEVAGDRRRVAILGNMNELGVESENFHRAIGKVVAKFADVLITVGKYAGMMAPVAKEWGMSDGNVHSFTYTKEAIEFFKDKIEENDLVLIKGSQNRVRLERLVKELMKYPEDAKDLLVRQEKEWVNL